MSNEQAAKDYWFFLSYAKRNAESNLDADGVPHVKRFFEELANQLAELSAKTTATRPEEVGFFDEVGIEAGGVSYAQLTDALSASRVMVCLFSPAYFQREFCGKELEYFRGRQTAWSNLNRGEQPPKVIVPLYWDEPALVLKQLPDSVKQMNIEIAERELGVGYAKYGLKYLLRQSTPRGAGELYAAYEEFLRGLSLMLLSKGEYANERPMPPPQGRPSIETVKHPFPAAAGSGATASTGKGPDVAKFFYVTARRDEFDPQDSRRDFYSDKGWLDWQPFNPPLDDNIEFIAAQVTGKNKFRYRVEDLNDDIKDDLERANQDNVVAVVVVDAWSLRLPRYRELMLRCDSISLNNTVFLIVRNAEDKTVAGSEKDIETWLKLAFPTKASGQNKAYFVNPINSPRDLQKHIREAIIKARNRILEYNELKKRIETGTDSLPTLPAGGASV
jgi:FxsC-like protein